jgi:hypothetical protein
MDITSDIIEKSVNQQPFGTFEPFITGDDVSVDAFYADVLAGLEQLPCVGVEHDDHVEGYASYVSAFLFPSDGRSRQDFADRIETTGILLYMSRLAPIAAYGASSRTANKLDSGRGLGFLTAKDLGILPEGDWAEFWAGVQKRIHAKRVEFLAREPLLLPAPEGVSIPTVFDGPYYVFDTLFYWCD